MASRPGSEVQLARILQLLPVATREAGVSLAELARRLAVSESEIVRDLGEVIGRSYYRPAGSMEEVTVLIEPERVEVWTTNDFRRPPRLNRREAIALGLALRMLAAQEGDSAPAAAGVTDRPGTTEPPPGGAYSELAARLEGRLLSPVAAPAPSAAVEVGAGAIAPSAVHGTLLAAARDRRRCRILYLRSGAAEPEAREIDPYVLLIASGGWYVIGHCHARAGMRVFRVDRILGVERLADEFVVPPDFDPNDYIADGRVYRAEEFEEVVIRYSARIARWIMEQGPTEPLPDGGVLVRYSVADPRWAVRHVLEHAPEAEVLAPPAIRAAVRAGMLPIGSSENVTVPEDPEPT